MQAYIIRRLLLMIPTLLLATIIVFFVVRLIPGSVIDQMVSAKQFGGNQEAIREKIEHALGLDVPIYVQYGRWVAGIFLHGDLGNSLWKGTPVSEEIASRIPVTIELAAMALIASLLISFPIGIYSAIRQDTGGDYVGRSFAIACIALPGFWIGTLIMIFPSIWWGWSPLITMVPFVENPVKNLGQFIIPAIVLGMVLSGVNMRMTRTMMLEVLRQDYIRTAWSKGLTENVVILRHALKNGLIPVVTLLGIHMPFLIGGTVIIEQIFCLPGLGRLILDAALQRDYPIITGTMLIFAFVILVINLIVDLTYGYLDPRVRYQ